MHGISLPAMPCHVPTHCPTLFHTRWRTQELNGFHTIRECVINFEFEDTNKVCGHRNERCCRRPCQSTVSQSTLCRAIREGFKHHYQPYNILTSTFQRLKMCHTLPCVLVSPPGSCLNCAVATGL